MLLLETPVSGFSVDRSGYIRAAKLSFEHFDCAMSRDSLPLSTARGYCANLSWRPCVLRPLSCSISSSRTRQEL